MKKEKALLREKLVEFQLRIAELTHALSEQEQTFLTKEQSLYLNLFEVLDAFENLDENIAEKEGTFDKTTRRLVKSVRSIEKKIVRLLKSNHIVEVTFPDNRAAMDSCKVVDTKEVGDMENETILSVVRKGYINTEENVVLRKAEVLTVMNG